jgi:hypothetical protein
MAGGVDGAFGLLRELAAILPRSAGLGGQVSTDGFLDFCCPGVTINGEQTVEVWGGVVPLTVHVGRL